MDWLLCKADHCISGELIGEPIKPATAPTAVMSGDRLRWQWQRLITSYSRESEKSTGFVVVKPSFNYSIIQRYLPIAEPAYLGSMLPNPFLGIRYRKVEQKY